MPGEIRLQWWRDALGGAGRGEVDAHPVAASLRDVVVRYRLPPRMLVELIDARSFDLYDEPMASLSYLERYAAQTSSALLELAARILGDGRDLGTSDLTRHAGIAYAIAGLLRALPIHAARGQLYLPADLMQRHGAQSIDVLAGTGNHRAARGAGGIAARGAASSRCGAWPAQRLGAAGGSRAAAGRAGAARTRPHGTPELSAVQPERTAAMAAAMGAVAGGTQWIAQGVLNYSAAMRAPLIH